MDGSKYVRAPIIYPAKVAAFSRIWTVRTPPKSKMSVDLSIPRSAYYSNFPPPLSLLNEFLSDMEIMALKLYANGDVGLIKVPEIVSERELVTAAVAVTDARSVLRRRLVDAVNDGTSVRVAMKVAEVGTNKSKLWIEEGFPPGTIISKKQPYRHVETG